MTTWDVSKEFRLLTGSSEFNAEALSHLTKHNVRLGPDLHCYVFTTTVDAESSAQANLLANSKLLEIVAPYGVQAHVYASLATERGGR